MKGIEDGYGFYAGSFNAQKQKEGFGIKWWRDGGMHIGMWKAGKANGKSWFFTGDGDAYRGDVVDDKLHGHGVFLQVDGQKYVGLWEDD